MKTNIVLALLGLLSISVAGADEKLCGVRLVEMAQQTLEKTQTFYDVGMATSYEMLMAEKQVLDLKLCNDPYEFITFTAVSSNILKRLDYATTLFENGMVISANIGVIKSERQGLYILCATDLVPAAEARFNSGMVTKQTLAELKKSCEALK